jgi:hypothetical protein
LGVAFLPAISSKKRGDLDEKAMVICTVSDTSCEDYQSRYRPVEKQVDDL